MDKISEVTKRDIQDLFKCGVTLPDGTVKKVYWYGRLEDADFLSRLYNLSDMPSYDSRYKDANGDIRCHVGWNDWEEDWVFTDPRFNILHGDDETFLRFICETFHPAVTRNSVEDFDSAEMYMFKEVQRIIKSEGYELYEINRLGNKPVFGWRMVGAKMPIQQQTDALKEVFTSEYLNTQIDQMQKSVKSNPGDAIGKAKELIESCCKTILEKSGIEVDEKWEIPKLLKETISVLDLLPEDVKNEKVHDAVKIILGNLSQMAFQLAMIRNKMGTGHGKADSFSGLEPRHAELAVGSAAVLCWFLWESYQS